MNRLSTLMLLAGLIAQIVLLPVPSYSRDPNMYAQGLEAEISENYSLAIENYTLAANEGLSAAKFALGRLYRDIYSDSENSFKWFLEAANAGDVFAQYEIGTLYLKGNSSAPDIDNAKQWLTSAARRGNHGEAAYTLFEMSDQDDVKLSWLKQAANQGVIRAMQRLGQAYRNGELGLNRDLSKSENWIELATQAQE